MSILNVVIVSVPKSIKVVPGAAIKHLKTFGEAEDLPDGCVKRVPELSSWLGKLFKTAPASAGHIAERRKAVVAWLKRNQINVTNNEDGSMTVLDVARIVEPYTADDCISVNPFILKRLKKLVGKMPEADSL
ncbi:unnamed protein product [Gongylonema pulchrum]|uniref:Gemin6_C domain-containing protein n=1 Tax=Gongylonema pulchrum TaxID=637853 RepID=A0A183EDQ9_9BILA|nr:unnamed protein product [Gongylonema pulchrum]